MKFTDRLKLYLEAQQFTREPWKDFEYYTGKEWFQCTTDSPIFDRSSTLRLRDLNAECNIQEDYSEGYKNTILELTPDITLEFSEYSSELELISPLGYLRIDEIKARDIIGIIIGKHGIQILRGFK